MDYLTLNIATETIVDVATAVMVVSATFIAIYAMNSNSRKSSVHLFLLSATLFAISIILTVKG